MRVFGNKNKTQSPVTFVQVFPNQTTMASNYICSVHITRNPTSIFPSIPSSLFLKIRDLTKFNSINNGSVAKTRDRRKGVIVCGLLPVDPWAPTIDSQSIASQLFAFSLFPYLGFLYFITKSKSAPKLTVFGFYFLLAFVGATSKFSFRSSLLVFNQFMICILLL